MRIEIKVEIWMYILCTKRLPKDPGDCMPPCPILKAKQVEEGERVPVFSATVGMNCLLV